jgi:hypothetical protein
MTSAVKWKAHTSTAVFASKFDSITEQFASDNELRSQKIEEFLIAEAKSIGVIKTTSDRIQKNPNRWSKHLAPWYNDTCKEAKREYKKVKRRKGRKHANTKTAYTTFKDTCKKEKAKLQFALPEILKY